MDSDQLFNHAVAFTKAHARRSVEEPCHFQAWVKGHYTIDKVARDDANLATWQVEHTAMLQAEIARLQADGWKCSIERYLRVTGQTAILGGKPDVVAQKTDRRSVVIDCKSGQERDSDVAQVLIYMVALPLAWNSPTMIFDGEVVYRTHRVPVPAKQVEPFRPRLFALLKQLARADVRPEPVPSAANCRFCDVTKADCHARTDATEQVDVMTSEF